jgi:hypothetical protein
VSPQDFGKNDGVLHVGYKFDEFVVEISASCCKQSSVSPSIPDRPAEGGSARIEETPKVDDVLR